MSKVIQLIPSMPLADVHTLGDTKYISQTPADKKGFYRMTIQSVKTGMKYSVPMNLFQGLNL